jgi:tRNA dimethylallyltransferase
LINGNVQNNDLPAAVVICGPTGIGKTSFAIALAKRFHGEIIGADSMQLFRRMDIGTAKPTSEERAAVTHHMVDVVEPDEHFDAEMFAGMAYAKVLELSQRGVLPFVVGGTGLYIKSLIHGLFETVKVDPEVRRRLKEEAAAKGGQHLYRRLVSCDPAAAARIHENDTYRIVRALEVFETSRTPLSARQRSHQFSGRRLRTLKIGLFMERADLYRRIDRRVDAMIRQGLLQEVEGLVGKGYSKDLKSMRSLGYRHMAEYLSGAAVWEEAVRTLKRDTRRYAKRQMTWFRADPEVVWLGPDDAEAAASLVSDFLLR